jgi:hypothetical protein
MRVLARDRELPGDGVKDVPERLKGYFQHQKPQLCQEAESGILRLAVATSPAAWKMTAWLFSDAALRRG